VLGGTVVLAYVVSDVVARNRHWHSSRDENEQAIIAEFLASAAIVLKLATTANTGLPDLLIGHGGKWALVEVKMPGNGLRAAQERFRAKCEIYQLPWFLADHIDDVPVILKQLRNSS
jgi:hypothetical protein